MFEKLLSLLPYNPGLVHEMAFYGRRMREEASIRRTGLVFITLAFMVQFVAVLSPPQSTSAAPSNDLITGGFSSAAQAASDCRNNTQGYQDILNNYGITCKAVGNSPSLTIASTDHNRQLFSMGHNPYGLTGEQPVYIHGTKFYVRPLWAWDKGGPATPYTALRILASDGTLYYLLYGCGNLVSVGVPKPFTPPTPLGHLTPPQATTPAPTPPNLGLLKTSLAGFPVANSNVATGTTLGYRVYIGNSGGAADNVTLKDTLPPDTTFQWLSPNAGASGHTYDAGSRTALWTWSTIPNEAGTYYVDLKVTVNASAPNGERICNRANISAPGTSKDSNEICMTVVKNAPAPVTTPTSTPMPTPTPVTPTTPPASCPYDVTLPIDSPQCKICQKGATSLDCVVVSKSATNQTQNIADANNSTAQPNDIITYNLYAKNDSKGVVKQYAFQENLADVMVYADPVDLHGGKLDSTTGIVSWPSSDITAGSTTQEQVTVKVKATIPANSPDPADQGRYDLTMTNVYGNTINIHVPAPPAQAIVTASASLPNTGPGTGLFITGAVMMVAGYFYARSRLLASESAIAIKESVVV